MINYFSKSGVEYIQPDSTSYYVIDILPFLIGRPWDQLALNWVHAVNPSCIRVTDGFQTLDSRIGRVTVTVRKNMLLNNKGEEVYVITDIKQEVEVGCVGVENGYDLRVKTLS